MNLTPGYGNLLSKLVSYAANIPQNENDVGNVYTHIHIQV